MTNENDSSVKKKGFTITIFGIGDYHPDPTSEEEINEDLIKLNAEAKVNGDLIDLLKTEADRFRKRLEEQIGNKAFLVSSCINNIKLADSNDKYPDSGSFETTSTR
jgi:hypothetical protein